MNFKACPVCGQIPTAYFDFTKPAVVAQHICATAGSVPPRVGG